jgi:hypothetical protein
MTGELQLVFEVADVTAEEQLLRTYIRPAFERFWEHEDVRWPLFNRYGQDPAAEQGELRVTVFGDVETVVADERPRWIALDESGRVINLHVRVTEAHPTEMNKRRQHRYRVRAAASRMSLAFIADFDELPPAVTHRGGPVGWELCLHHLINQLGYQGDNGREEIDLLFEGIAARLRAMTEAPDQGVTESVETVNRLQTELELVAEELQTQTNTD